jgi:hypothetical protein
LIDNLEFYYQFDQNKFNYWNNEKSY